MPVAESDNKMRYSEPKHTFPLAYALVAFTVIWIFALLSGVNWSSMDDPVISYVISMSPDDVSVFQQNWLIKFIYNLNTKYGKINFWIILSIFSVSVGISACCFAISKKHSDVYAAVFTIAAVLIGYFFTVRFVSFTCTSIMSSCGGIALIIDYICERSSNKRHTNICEYLTGILLLMLSFGIREEAGFIGLGYLAVIGVLSFIIPNPFSVKTFVGYNFRKIILLAIPAVLCLGIIAVNEYTYSETEREYKSYNKICASIRDYPATYPSWESGEESYSSLGLSPNDYDLLFNRWVFDDPEVFSRDKLEEIGSLKFSRTPLKTFLFMPFDAFRGMIREPSLAVLLALGLAVSVFTLLKKSVRLRKVIVLWIFELCYYLYIVWNGRIVTHVLFSILWGLDICLALISCSDPAPKRKNGHECQDNGNPEKADIGHARFYPAAILLATAVVAAGIKVSGNALQTVNNDYGTTENANRAFYDVLDSRREDTYILAPNLNKHSSRAYGPWSPFPEKYCENVFYLGGWQARAGYMVENLRSRGIENPMRALLEGEKVYSMIDENTPCILTFLREHYDACASYSIVELIGAEQMIRYCGVLREADIALPETISERHTASCNMTAGTPMVLISGELTKNEKVESISEVYCTLQAGDHEYSYVLAYDGKNSFSGCPIVVDGNGAEPDLTTLRILVKTSAGELLEVPKAVQNDEEK